jgi:superfamily II DNA or RNA helicase
VIGDREVLVELENFSLREQPGYNSRGTKDLLHWKDKNISKVLDLPRSLHETLFHHQLEGVQWLWGLHNNTAVTGGILGDDMGLGKTIQVTSLLVGLIRMGLIRNVLIVAPISVLESWEREINSHLRPNVSKAFISQINASMSIKKRRKALVSIATTKTVSIAVTSFHLLSNMIDDFNDVQWDYVILDEGHIIKNGSTKISKAVSTIHSGHRLLLTGTPIQNNLMEFYQCLQWATGGTLLGSPAHFQSTVVNPILAGQHPKASIASCQAAVYAAKKLKQITSLVLLRRSKSEVNMNKACHAEAKTEDNLPKKTEIIIWTPLSKPQHQLYDIYLTSAKVLDAISGARVNYPVEIINHLKTICRHPFLLAREKEDVPLAENLDMSNLSEALLEVEDSITTKSEKTRGKNIFCVKGRTPSASELLSDSFKLQALVSLLNGMSSQGHRTLVFSQSKLMLDIIAHVLEKQNLSFSRIDGSTKQIDRQIIIDAYNRKDTAPPICLLTTKACGYGITLTGADRVVIFDPSWNPAEDRQAVDRAYRIGQKKPVIVYRMIMGGTIEEKMYEKQVFKDGLRVVTEQGESAKYFSSEETKQLFAPPPKEGEVFHNSSSVMEMMWRVSGEKIRHDQCPDGISIPCLGYSRHDNLYSSLPIAQHQNTKSTGGIRANNNSTHSADSDFSFEFTSVSGDGKVRESLCGVPEESGRHEDSEDEGNSKLDDCDSECDIDCDGDRHSDCESDDHSDSENICESDRENESERESERESESESASASASESESASECESDVKCKERCKGNSNRATPVKCAIDGYTGEEEEMSSGSLIKLFEEDSDCIDSRDDNDGENDINRNQCHPAFGEKQVTPAEQAPIVEHAHETSSDISQREFRESSDCLRERKNDTLLLDSNIIVPRLECENMSSKEYNSFLEQAETAENCKDYEKCAAYYCAALAVDSKSPTLHYKLTQLCTRLLL